MALKTTDSTHWLTTPPGQYLLAWERAQFADAVSDVFGYHAVQIGTPELAALHANRMPHRWLATQTLALPTPVYSSLAASSAPTLPLRPTLVTDSRALPFAENSLDLVVMPHTLEQSPDPHASLREVERVLVPEGRVVISGLNPASLWGMRQSRGYFYPYLGRDLFFLPQTSELIGYRRLRDWLRLLGFEVESARFGCYRPALSHEKWLARFDWMDKVGQRWWPIFGAVYIIVAVKRVRGMRLLGPTWKSRQPAVVGQAAVASKKPTAKNHVP